ncbi:uncharacterized protein LOC141855385 [Brevipalpus obovatus]|uniref:uncharacterized protein LOC141855385 n=1 Tax=Brevipalpus obovatus TaxID=246614 RepID=UPI003D9E978E
MMSKSYVTIQLRPVSFFDSFKSKIIRPLPPDLLLCGHDGYGRKVHSTLLLILSAKFSSWCEAVRDNGHSVTNFLIPTMDRLGIDGVYDLIYNGYFRIDESKLGDFFHQISQFDLPLSVLNQKGQPIGDMGTEYTSEIDLRVRNPPNLVEIHPAYVNELGPRAIHPHLNHHPDHNRNQPIDNTNNTSTAITLNNTIGNMNGPIELTTASNLMKMVSRAGLILPNSPEIDFCDEEEGMRSPNSSPPIYSEVNSDVEVPNGNSNNSDNYMNGNENPDSPSYEMSGNMNGSDMRSKSLKHSSINNTSTHPVHEISNGKPSPYGPRLSDGRYKCSHCEKTFANSRNRKEHILALHLGHTLPCPKCGAKFRHRSTLRGHLLKHPKTTNGNLPNSSAINDIMDHESQLAGEENTCLPEYS